MRDERTIQLKTRLGVILSAMARPFGGNLAQLARAVGVGDYTMRRWANPRDAMIPTFEACATIVKILESEKTKAEVAVIVCQLRLGPELGDVLAGLLVGGGAAGSFEGLNKLAALAAQGGVTHSFVRLVDRVLDYPASVGPGQVPLPSKS